MKLTSFTIKNFRGYRDEVRIEVNNLVAFVGKNDIGKSTILEALDVFFNEGKGLIKLDDDDFNKNCVRCGDKEIVLSACFSELPEYVIIDVSNPTVLSSEYMLNTSNELEIVKRYCSTAKPKTFIRANHPSNPACSDLLDKKDKDLQKIISEQGITCSDQTRKAVMRKAIWDHYHDQLSLSFREIEISKGDVQEIYTNIQRYLPVYSLFQSDRKNTDTDTEVQDPLKEAVKEIIGNPALQAKLSQIAEEVTGALRDVASRTRDKIAEMAPELAAQLEPNIPDSASLKWADVFKNVTISGENDIPMSKRGSGIRRLILLNFFRAEAERKLQTNTDASIIYAIEEPETSQHASNQRKLIDALIALSRRARTQVLISTHSSQVVKCIGDYDCVRIIAETDQTKVIKHAQPNCLAIISSNEINYLAFGDYCIEYHNELYGYIDAEQRMNQYIAGRATRLYKRIERNGTEKEEHNCLSRYIRDQIHHPENTLNEVFTAAELCISIENMRNFILTDMRLIPSSTS